MSTLPEHSGQSKHTSSADLANCSMEWEKIREARPHVDPGVSYIEFCQMAPSDRERLVRDVLRTPARTLTSPVQIALLVAAVVVLILLAYIVLG